MSSIKAHFDGTAVVLDEPASLAVGQALRVMIVDPDATSPSPPSPAGSWKGKLRIVDDGDDVVLDHFAEYLP